MSLLDSASLVVTPNGYKASKLYSIVPSDGTGDMTFARTGDTATRVNSSGLIETVLADKPRLDYTGGGCPKLLLEPQRTNLLQRSQEFDNAYWLKSNCTITANSVNSPDGTQNADTIANTANGGKIYKAFTSTAGYYTLSVFVKKGTTSKAFLNFYNGAIADYVCETDFDLIAGTYTGAIGGSAFITDYGNNYWRIGITYNLGSSSASEISIGLNRSTTGNSYIYGAQLEAGSYATSYIPTTSASVTRNIDSAYKTSASALIGQTEGTMFLDARIYKHNNYNTLFILTHASGTGSGYVVIDIYPNNTIVCEYNNGSSQAKIISSGTYIDTRVKVAFAYKANDFVAYINGTQIGIDTSGSTNVTLSNINIPFTSNVPNGGVYSAVLWKTRLQNADLAALTTI